MYLCSSAQSVVDCLFNTDVSIEIINRSGEWDVILLKSAEVFALQTPLLLG
jgi:hypothetical protein